MTSTSTKSSSSWSAPQKTLVQHGHARKWRRIDHGGSRASPSNTSAFPRNASSPPLKRRHDPDNPNASVDLETTEVKNGESIAALRKMVLGKIEYKNSQNAAGKYLALDCEMVGVGIEGNESSLARVSIVNYTGAIILDVFVRQRERVVDYRTQWSGVRSTDLAGSAKPFKEVQQTVADLIKDRILVGHAIYNDLKALLLSHPSPQLRDTQSLAYKHHVVKSRRPALRVLVKQELGVVIQGGEHSSVTDARATMALFRLYKKQWESGFRPLRTLVHPQLKVKADVDPAGKAVAPAPSEPPLLMRGKKRKLSESSKSDGEGVNEVAEGSNSPSQLRAHSSSSSVPRTRSPMQHAPTPSQRRKQSNKLQPPVSSTGRKGISSGISTVIRKAGGVKEVRNGKRVGDSGQKGGLVGSNSKGGKRTNKEWWKSLEGGKKGSIRL